MKVDVKPKKEHFTLKEVKSTDRASLKVKAEAKVEGNGIIPYDAPYADVPHPDLFSLIDSLKMRFAQYFDYDKVKILVSNKDFGGKKEHIKYAEKMYEELMENIKINGVSFVGKGEDGNRTGIIIKGTYKGCALNTKQMHFGNQDFGSELAELADKLEDEVYEYLFEDKKAQLEAFDDDDKDDELPFDGKDDEKK